ncbi:hypothetical protein [Dysgonomonas sp. BGC7]|uniref:hypothetical protein n=1 Tax=Dysgonomonas sp. BGC7 TaxID=1658008 RepID=UPI00068003EC|nr:hypothetical protein [Dysgonomonas sp. BGC7]MBD8390089.1 hypothetical protein [Dysgonomonas sp. BGC7]
MERLKAILADKILDIPAGNGDDVKIRIDKIQRFRDFANACKTLMIKYPAIEDELIEMVNNGDFDTKVASSRVDTIIRLADTEASRNDKSLSQETTIKEKIEGASEEMIISESVLPEVEMEQEDDIKSTLFISSKEEEYNQPEDVEYEELDSSDDVEEYNSYEKEEPKPDEAVEEVIYPSEEELAVMKRKTTIRRILQVAGIVVAVLALIFIIRFVMSHWQIILIVLGVITVLSLLFVWYKRKHS